MGNKKSLAPLVLLTVAFNVEANNEQNHSRTACPPSVVLEIESQFGPGSAAMTECLAKRGYIKVVAAWNNDDLNARSGISQQVVNINNMVSDYAKYGIVLDEDNKIVAIGYGLGARWLLKDAAYVAKVDATAAGNPSRAAVEGLLAKGVRVFMCQNTMRGAGYTVDDLIEGISMVPAGVTAVVDYEKRNYKYLVP